MGNVFVDFYSVFSSALICFRNKSLSSMFSSHTVKCTPLSTAYRYHQNQYMSSGSSVCLLRVDPFLSVPMLTRTDLSSVPMVLSLLEHHLGYILMCLTYPFPQYFWDPTTFVHISMFFPFYSWVEFYCLGITFTKWMTFGMFPALTCRSLCRHAISFLLSKKISESRHSWLYEKYIVILKNLWKDYTFKDHFYSLWLEKFFWSWRICGDQLLG